MPVSKAKAASYPGGSLRSRAWFEIRARILHRAKHKCEQCGVNNYAVGYRYNSKLYRGAFINITDRVFDSHAAAKAWRGESDYIIIVLTIAHLDHNPSNNSPDNLSALCQRCHNKYDARHRAENRRASKRAARCA